MVRNNAKILQDFATWPSAIDWSCVTCFANCYLPQLNFDYIKYPQPFSTPQIKINLNDRKSQFESETKKITFHQNNYSRISALKLYALRKNVKLYTQLKQKMV